METTTTIKTGSTANAIQGRKEGKGEGEGEGEGEGGKVVSSVVTGRMVGVVEEKVVVAVFDSVVVKLFLWEYSQAEGEFEANTEH